MPKSAIGSHCKNPKEHSSKDCVCGSHNAKAQHAKPKGKRPVRLGRPSHVPVLG